MDATTKSPLGKKSSYRSTYAPELLFSIPRIAKRDEIGVPSELPFHGVDTWTGYELSWLNTKGKPQIAIVEIQIPCQSPNLIESKSFKLYLNSFNQTKFDSVASVQQILVRDLTQFSGQKVIVNFGDVVRKEFSGECLDSIDIETDRYEVDPEFLSVKDQFVEERLYSDLLKSNCLVTGQPDWGSVWIHYVGPKIDREGLLKYIISFRQHNEFHEQCIERLFMDISRYCHPEKLTVYGKYTRRGGLDINPYRSNFEEPGQHFLVARQ